MTNLAATRLAVGLLTLLAALTFWLDQVVQPAPPKQDGSTRHDEDFSAENFTITRFGIDGMPRYALNATKMTHYPDDDSTHLVLPLFTRVDSGKSPMRITSQRGMVSSNGDHAYFYDNVKVVRDARSDSGPLTIATSYLHVIPDQELAMTDKAVTIQDAHAVVTAVGLQSNNKTHIVKLLSHVRGHYEKAKK